MTQKIFSSSGETKYYNVMIDGKNVSDQPVKRDLRKYDNIRKQINLMEI